MTEHEAIKDIQRQLWEINTEGSDIVLSTASLRLAIKALKKQIAKKPFQRSASIIDCFGIKKEFVKDVCPCCGSDLDDREQFREYPCRCGQKLDWE